MENLSEKLSSFKNNSSGIFFHILLIISFICLIGSSLHAQNHLTPKAKTKRSLVYQFPKSGDKNVQSATTLILRYSEPLSGVHLTDLSFHIKGEQSGEHLGKIKVCDDDVTIIFVPDSPFILGEKVIAAFQDESLAPTSFNFHITSMTAEKQAYWMRYFREKEETENREFRMNANQRQRQSANTPQDILPSYYPKITIDANSAVSDPGNIFITPSGISELGKSIAFISMVNNSGIPLYNREIIGHGIVTADFKVQKNNMLTFPNATMDGFYEMDSHFRIVDSFKCGNGLSADIHDFELMPNGDAILVAYNPVNTGTSIVADNVIQVIGKDKNVKFQWNALGPFAVSDATHEDTLAAAVDFAHINSIQSDTDGNIIASFRNLDEVTKINRETGEIMWHFGGKHNQFRFVGDTLQFSHQHHARRIANGNITIFDNGNFHSVLFQGEPIVASSSRAVEYDLNVLDSTATVKWQYKNMPYSNAAGSVQRLPNGNTLIGTGNLSSPSAIEVSSTGNVLFQLSLPEQIVSYRAYKFDWTPAQVRTVKSTEDLTFKSIFPNPAENSTTAVFLAEVGTIELNISDVLGHTVRSLNQTILQAGENIFSFNLSGLPEGVYYCKLSQNGRMSTKTVVVQK